MIHVVRYLVFRFFLVTLSPLFELLLPGELTAQTADTNNGQSIETLYPLSFSASFKTPYPVEAGIEGVDVSASARNCTLNYQSAANGIASGGLCNTEKQTIYPIKNTDPLDGINAFDLVLISRHTLGLENLGNPYKIIAADVNRNNSVTTFDAVALQKLILRTIKSREVFQP